MRIYFDSKDLIDLFEKKDTIYLEEFKNAILNNSHVLVLSLSNTLEICAPLNKSNPNANVMRLLNRIEAVPHSFIAEAKIPISEIKEAISAFEANREYVEIDPFVARFDYVVSPFTDPPTRDYLSLSLAEAVWMLWNEDNTIFSGWKAPNNQLKALLEADRCLEDKPTLKKHFPTVLMRYLRQAKINYPQSHIKELATWILSSASRCPGLQLGYATFHKLLKNKFDISSNTDIGDLVNIGCLPYVDVMTLDRQARAYVKQASSQLGIEYMSRIYSNLDEVRNLITMGRT